MTTQTQVCNMALSKIGANPITTFGSTTTKEDRACNTYFSIALANELRKYNWNFAIRRDSLTVDFLAPAWGFDHQYAVPDDYLRLVEVDGLSTTEYQVENGYIVCDETSDLDIRYVALVEDPTNWDACFVEAFACALALRITEDITASEQTKQSIRADYKDWIKEARATDAIENPPEEIPEDDWNLARQ